MALRNKKLSSIRLCIWNANSITFRRQELIHFLHHHEIDAILISETHLRPGRLFKVPNYDIYRSDRPNGRGGGTAVLIKNSIAHHSLPTPQLQEIEATAVIIETATMGHLKIVAVYNRPAYRINSADLDSLLNTNVPTLIGGDLNAKHRAWNSRIENLNGNILNRYSQTRNVFVKGPTDPTHFPIQGHRPDVLDIILTSRVNANVELTTLSELDSDHNPVLVTVGNPEVAQPEIIVTRKTCWARYPWAIDDTLPPVPTINVPDDTANAVENLTTAIKSAIDRCTVEHQTRASNPMLLPIAIREQIRRKNTARKRWQRSWDPADKAEANRLQGQVKRAIQQYHNETWNAKLESLNIQDNSIWKMAKAMKRRSTIRNTPPLHGRHGLAYSDSDKAEALADSLESQCTATWDNADPDDIATIHRRTRRWLATEPDSQIRHTTPGEIKSILATLKAKKAPGEDRIPNTALKLLPKKAIAHLVAIFNAILRQRLFPDNWKTAEVITLLKPGKNPIFPQNYRPISLLPALSKVLETVILARLKEETDDLQLIPDTQIGFRAKHSTTHQTLRVVEQIAKGFTWKHTTGAVLLDVAKAFDSVWHRGLIHKMRLNGISLPMCQIISSFLQNRKFRIKMSTCKSTVRPIEAGVPQGSVLAPMLFNIYVSDLPALPGASMALYADDTAILVTSRSVEIVERRLQEYLEILQEWYSKWRIKVNTEKSSAILFTKRRIRPTTDLTLFGANIPWTNQARYLGILLDHKLTWKLHIESQCNKANGILALLFPLLTRNSKLTRDNKLLLYKTMVLPILTYAGPVWSYASKSHVKRMESLQGKALRMIVDAPWFVSNLRIREELQITPITSVLIEAARSLDESLPDHPNQLIAPLWQYDRNNYQRHHRPREVIL